MKPKHKANNNSLCFDNKLLDILELKYNLQKNNLDDAIEKKEYNKIKDKEKSIKINEKEKEKEKEKFPCKFDKCVDLKEVLDYYNKNWGEGILSDEENDGDDDSDKVKNNLKNVSSSSSSSSSSKKKRKKKNIYDSSSSD